MKEKLVYLGIFTLRPKLKMTNLIQNYINQKSLGYFSTVSFEHTILLDFEAFFALNFPSFLSILSEHLKFLYFVVTDGLQLYFSWNRCVVYK